MISDLSDIDLASPIDWTNTRNAGLVMRLLGLPGTVGGNANWPDITRRTGGAGLSSPTWVPTIRGDSALAFNGSSKTTQPTFGVYSTFSVVFTVQLVSLPSTNGGNNSNIWVTDSYDAGAGSGGWGVGIGNGGGLTGSTLTGLANSVAWVGSGYTFPSVDEYRIGMTINGSAWRFYVGGSLVGTATHSLATPTLSLATFNIGGIGAQSILNCKETVSDISLYLIVQPDSFYALDYAYYLAGYPDLRRVRSLRSIALMGSGGGGGGDTGSSSITLDACTVSSAGSLHLQAASSITMGDVMLTSHGRLAIAGSGSVALGPVTLTSNGALAIQATAGVTLAAVTLTSAGSANPSADASITLGSLQLSSSGTLALRGSAGLLLAPLTLIAEGFNPSIQIVTPGGAVRRVVGLSRVARRKASSYSRIIRRTVGLSRIARRILTMGILWTRLPKDSSEAVEYIFDFSGFDEATAGEVLTSVSVPAVSGLTIGTPSIIAADTNLIPKNLGAKVLISEGTPTQVYDVECQGTFTSGAVRVVKLELTIE